MTVSDNGENGLRELLPWHVNGTLSAEEKQDLQRLIRDDPQAVAELEFLEQVRNTVRAAEYGSPGPFGLRRLRESIAQEERQAASRKPASPGWWRGAAVAAVLVVVLQAGLLLDRDLRDPGGGYRPAGDATDQMLVQVRFQPAATESQIRRLLTDLEMRIVDGPGSVGLYRLQAAGETEDLALIIQRLQTNPDIVLYAAEE